MPFTAGQKGRFDLGWFFAASLLVHGAVAAASLLIVADLPRPSPAVIHVRVITDPPPVSNADLPHGRLIEAPPPARTDAHPPEKAEALASFNAQAGADPASAGLRLAMNDGAQAMRAAVPRRETQRRKKEADLPKSPGGQQAPVPQNRFAAETMPAAKSDQTGQTAKAKVDDGVKPDRDTQPATAALSAADIDSFAAANPSGVKETGSEIIIPLNTRKFEYADYFSGIRRGIENVWAYPYEAVNAAAGGRTVIRFTIGRTGALEEARVIISAGMAVLDNAAVAAVRNAGPFTAFPPGLDKEKIHIVATFTYQPSYGKVP